MPYTQKPVLNSTFCKLVGDHPGTGVAHVPLLVWWDTINSESSDINFHRDFLSLYIAQRGQGTHIINGVHYAISRGDVYVMGQGMEHQFVACDNLQLHTLHFSPEVFDRQTLDILADTPGFLALFVEEPLRRAEQSSLGGRWLHLTPEALTQIEDDMAELRAEWQSGTASGGLITRGLFLRLLVHLARHYASTHVAPGLATVAPSGVRDVTVASALRMIEAHYTEALRIEQIAASVFLSPDRFTEVFAATMGRTPGNYIRHLRLERAKSLLTSTDESVSYIATEAGFGEPAYFTRVFHAAIGMTPSAYRATNRVIKRA